MCLQCLTAIYLNAMQINGAVIHVTMDGLTGGYQLLDLMSENYRNLDNRANARYVVRAARC